MSYDPTAFGDSTESYGHLIALLMARELDLLTLDFIDDTLTGLTHDQTIDLVLSLTSALGVLHDKFCQASGIPALKSLEIMGANNVARHETDSPQPPPEGGSQP